MTARARKSAAYSIPVLIVCAVWLLSSSPRSSPAAPSASGEVAMRARAYHPEQADPPGQRAQPAQPAQPASAGMAAPAASADDSQSSAILGPFPPKRVEMPVADRATGGPYVDAETIRLSALGEAADRGAVDPQAESVRFMTYGEAVAWYGTGSTPEMDPYREVYVVSVPGRLTLGHHVRVSYTRSYYIYDASSGRLVQFGANDLDDPFAMGRPLPR